MNWYIVKMVFRIRCGNGDHTAQFDEQLRLISAGSKEEAFHKAQALGGREEEIFFSKQQQLVQWQFIGVSELYQLGELADGAELYSRIEEQENADVYLHILAKKAEQIRFGTAVEWLKSA